MLDSARARLTLLQAGLIGAFLASMAAYVCISDWIRTEAAFDEVLVANARMIGHAVIEELREAAAGVVEDWPAVVLLLVKSLEGEAMVLDAAGKVMVRSPGVPAGIGGVRWAPEPEFTPGGESSFKFVTLIHEEPGFDRIQVVFGRDHAPVERRLARERTGILIAVPALTLVGAAVGHLFVKGMLRPVDQMARLAREISIGDLARRVPVPPLRGELHDLALTVNSMLARLEESVGRLRGFTADAAHELRTPIAALRTILETSLDRPLEETRAAVQDALEELSRLGGIVERLLLLSTADSGRLVKRWDPVDLAEVADRVVQVASVAAGGKGIRVALERRNPPVVLGDRVLLLQAVHNVVENAVKYGRPGGKVDVIVDGQGLEVRDDGPGIPPEHLPRIFDRLYRGDPARSDQVPGVGLGLSIARAIVEAHGGRLTAASEPGATRFRFELPAEPSGAVLRT